MILIKASKKSNNVVNISYSSKIYLPLLFWSQLLGSEAHMTLGSFDLCRLVWRSCCSPAEASWQWLEFELNVPRLVLGIQASKLPWDQLSSQSKSNYYPLAELEPALTPSSYAIFTFFAYFFWFLLFWLICWLSRPGLEKSPPPDAVCSAVRFGTHSARPTDQSCPRRPGIGASGGDTATRHPDFWPDRRAGWWPENAYRCCTNKLKGKQLN